MHQSLDLLLEHYQSLRHFGEGLLIVGLLVELVVIIFLQKKGQVEYIVGIVSTALIIVGVCVETFGGARGDDVVRLMRAPRSLSSARQAAIADKLKPFGPHEAVLFEISDVDPEIAGITVDISKALASSGWKAGFDRYPPTPDPWLRAPATGVLVVVSPAAPEQTVIPAAKELVSQLLSNGLEANLSQAWVGAEPPIDNRIKVVVYVKGSSDASSDVKLPPPVTPSNSLAEWVNAISVLVLVGVTWYYARTTRRILSESEKMRKVAENQAASAASQASAANATLRHLRQQVEDLSGLGNSIVRSTIDSVVGSIERWKKLDIKGNFVTAYTFPSPSDLIPENAQIVTEHARRISDECVTLLADSFNDLRSAQAQIEILKQGSQNATRHLVSFNPAAYDPGPYLTSAFAKLQDARKFVT